MTHRARVGLPVLVGLGLILMACGIKGPPRPPVRQPPPSPPATEAGPAAPAPEPSPDGGS